MTTIELSNGHTVRVDPVGGSAFRIRTSPDGSFPQTPLERYRLIRFPDASDASDASESGDRLTMRSGSATLELDRGTAAIVVHSAEGDVEVRIDPLRLSFGLADPDRLYGLGDASRESLDRRGQRLDMWVRNVVSYVPIPYLMNTAGWGIFINSTRRVTFDLGHARADELRVTGTGATHDVTVFVGDLGQQLEAYTAVAGRPPMLPMESYGLTFVCNEKTDARGMLDDALRFRSLDIPCDTIGLEPGWMGEHYDYTTDKRWHPERFHLPTWMLSSDGELPADRLPDTFLGALDRLKFRLSLWLCCDYDLSHEAERRALVDDDDSSGTERSGDGGPGSDVDGADADVEHDARLEPPVFMDKLTDPGQPWFEHLKKFVDQGAGAFKLDGANQVMEHPDRAWGNGMRDDEMHNLYPALLAQQMHEGFVEHTGRRAMVYSAAGHAGSSRYVATWAGDTGGGPGPLASMLNLGLSGHSNTSCDMEVFTPEGIHFGFLQPWSQVCSWAYWRHPWLLGDELEPIFRSYANLRQRLMPYIYTMARKAADSGMPILRAMPLAFPDEIAADRLTADHQRHQYLLGDDLLVGAFTDRLWLPEGEWVDWWTGQRWHGGCEVQPEIPSDRGGPLFVRVGAILPGWPTARQSRTTPAEINWTIHLGPDHTASLYEDDGDTLAHEDGEFARTELSTRRHGDDLEVVVGPRRGTYAGMPQDRTHLVQVHGASRCDGVTVDDVEMAGPRAGNQVGGVVECTIAQPDDGATIRFAGVFTARD